MGIGIANLSIALKADVDDFNKTMATARQTIETFEQSALKAGRAMRRTGTLMTAGAAISTAAIGKLIQSSENLEDKYRELRTISGNTVEQQQEIRSVTEGLSEEFASNGGQIEQVDAAYQAFSAGVVDSKEGLQDFLSTTNQLATGGLIQLEEATELVALSLNTYGMEAEDASEVSDDLFTIIDQGKIRGEELAGSFGTLLPFANELGVSFDEISSSMAFMSRQFDSSRRAAFGIRSTMQQILKPSNNLKTVFAEMGMESGILSSKIIETRNAITEQKDEVARWNQSLRDAQAELQGLKSQQEETSRSMRDNRIEIREIRLQARKEGRDLTEEEKANIEELELANEELRLEQMKNRQEMESRKDEVENLESELSGAEETLENLRSKEEEQQKQLETNASVIGDQLVDEYGGLIPLIKEIGARAEESSEFGLQDLITNQRALQFVLPILNDEAGKFNEILSAMNDNAGAAANASETVKDSFRKDMKNSLEVIKNDLREIGKIFTKQLAPVLDKFSSRIDGMTSAFKGMKDATKSNIAEFMILITAIAGVVGPLLMVLGTVTIMASLLGTALIPVIAATAAGIGLLASAFKDIISGGEEADNAIAGLQNGFNNAKKFANDLYAIYKNQLAPAFSELGGAVRTTVDTIVSTISNAADGNMTFIGTLREIASVVGQAISFLADLIIQLQPLIEIAIKIGIVMFENLGPPLVELFKGIKQVVVDFIGQFVGILDLFGGAEESGNKLIGVVDAITSALGWLINGIGKLMQRFSGVIGIILSFLVPMGGIVKVINYVAKGLKPLIVGLKTLGGRGSMLKNVFFALGKAFQMVLNWVLKLLNPVIKAGKHVLNFSKLAFKAFKVIGKVIVGALKIIVGAFKPFIKILKWLLSILNPSLSGYVKSSFKTIIKVLVTFKKFVSKWFSFIKGIFLAYIGVILWVKDKLWKAFNLYIDAVKWVWKKFGEYIDLIIGLWQSVIDTIIDIFTDPTKVFNKVKELASSILDKLKDGVIPGSSWISDLVSEFVSIGKKLIDGVVKGIKKAAGKIGEAMKKPVKKAKDLWPGSPAEEGPWSRSGDPPEDVGAGMVQGLAKGISTNDTAVESSMTDVVSMDLESGVGMPRTPGASSGGIVVRDGAVVFEEGAFQGIQDEDVPQKVSEEIQKAFQEILDEADGVGE